MIQITLSLPSMASARALLNSLPDDLMGNVSSIGATGEEAVATAKGNKAVTVTAAEVIAERDATNCSMADAKKAVIQKKQEVVKPEPASTTTTAEPAAAPEPKVENSAPAVEYPVLQKAVFTLAGKSRDAASAVAQSFGVKTFKDLTADKWADALAAVNAKLAELEAA